MSVRQRLDMIYMVRKVINIKRKKSRKALMKFPKHDGNILFHMSDWKKEKAEFNIPGMNL